MQSHCISALEEFHLTSLHELIVHEQSTQELLWNIDRQDVIAKELLPACVLFLHGAGLYLAQSVLAVPFSGLCEHQASNTGLWASVFSFGLCLLPGRMFSQNSIMPSKSSIASMEETIGSLGMSVW